MKTIAISRLIGSNAGTIAKRVAERLGYDLVDKSVLQATLEQYGLTRFGKLYTSTPNIWDLANSKNLQTISMMNDTMSALAHRGRTVILARGAYSALSKYSDVMKVRIQASFPTRVLRMMERQASSQRKDIEAFVADDDKARMKFVKMFYNQKCCDATDFDLVVNTSILPDETAENWILETARLFESADTAKDGKSAATIQVDPTLLDAINYALERRI
ncbi:cytidylate kinase-like family protein [Pelagicoccus sp. SDUM812005]|uniref:cytidylate kinase-like family protein n=1 Tax=Pelagicoccus sp. SDUM812005 TaxID=3041257 RepID=UPI00280DBB19|nr:cytidylate kinase-like family protein [Pelagicoccus sp. SDUM812005]MDQ8182938.1 cytidylate kinase-like family protein [Pelagicoccus sp. SDUM812005]